MDNTEEYIIADGPDGLEKVLNELLQQFKTNPQPAPDGQYIMYQVGNQRSLIKVDTNQCPFKFWYFDLMGRPATIAVKDTIARFLWEKCGLKDQYLSDNFI